MTNYVNYVNGVTSFVINLVKHEISHLSVLLDRKPKEPINIKSYFQLTKSNTSELFEKKNMKYFNCSLNFGILHVSKSKELLFLSIRFPLSALVPIEW